MIRNRIHAITNWWTFCGVVTILVTLVAYAEEPLPQDLLTFRTEDAVIIEAASQSRAERSLLEDDNEVTRSGRQFGGYPGILPVGPCFTSKGVLGRCTSFRQCYPYFKLPDFNNWETWILGMYDTCSYFTASGRQMFGVCCTNPATIRPTQPPRPTPPTTTEEPDYPEEPFGPDPNPNPIPPNWPPPIPTHPPDHTIPPLPTHPPSPGWPGLPITEAPITARPTTKPTKPTQAPWQPQPWPPATKPTTTKSPWPPAFPTHPTTTRAPWPPTIPTHPTTTRAPWPPAIPTHPTTTRAPWPPTIPTHPTTTRAPWPPAIPTHPTTTRSPWPPTKPTTLEPPPGPHPELVTDIMCMNRIVGGFSTGQGEWPWIAALFNGGRQFCGGSLIDRTHILTAAHCVAHMSSWDVARLTVRLGDHNIKTNSEVQHIEKKVKRVVRHRGFDSRTLYNDVAILTLDSPVKITAKVSPICLPSGNNLYAGETATVIGWGSLRESGPQPAVLQQVSIPIWTNQECRAKYGNAAPGGIVEHFLCAGQANRDSCSGDSGGPLMIKKGRWVQVGIVSWGIGCGKGQYPGVYTRVTHFMPWITKNLK